MQKLHLNMQTGGIGFHYTEMFLTGGMDVEAWYVFKLVKQIIIIKNCSRKTKHQKEGKTFR